MSAHEHVFEPYVGLPVSKVGKRVLAWVPKRKVFQSGVYSPLPEMLRCACGEQGYEVPA